MRNSEQRPKVSIEDLLHLKRSERPAPDFWVNFDRELRQKQLSALVEKRSWLSALPQFFVRRAYLPIGATAILAFSLVSIKYYYPTQVVQVGNSTALSHYTRDASQENTSTVPIIATASSPLLNRYEASDDSVNEQPAIASEVRTAPAAVTPHLSNSGVDLPVTESPSARSIAANLAHFEQSEPEMMNAVLGSRLSSSTRLQKSTAPVVEMASLSINGSKRTRLLAHYNDRQSDAEPAVSDTAHERLTRRLGDNDFNDRLSRIGLKGDKVSLKF